MKKDPKTVFIILLCMFFALSGCSANNGGKTAGDTEMVDINQNPEVGDAAENGGGEQGDGVDITQNPEPRPAQKDAGDGSGDAVDITQEQTQTQEQAQTSKTPVEAVWVVYWDDEDYASKLASSPYDPGIICEFEAYFDGSGNIVKEERVKAQFRALKALPETADKKFYLTFVNDVVTPQKTSQKDTGILYEVLKDPAGHAAKVVNAALEDGYDGIEIDYEKIRDDLKLWGMFTAFENELIKAASSVNLPVRIVLEPSTPVEKIDLPKGAEYVVMCYNLYGYGTKPGPKADRDFLKELAQRFAPLSDSTGFAFANGGFDWDLSKNTIEPLTDLQGKALSASFGKGASRDEKSGDITFTYEKDGHKHEVFFADDVTIGIWTDVIREETGKDVRINIWRM